MNRQWPVSGLLLVGLCSCQAPPLDGGPSARQSAISPPAPGQTIDIEFETDAAGNALPRGTVLGEQYAALGVHFHNGYIIGDRATDFSIYVDAPTPDNFVCTREGGTPGGCGSIASRPPTGVPLEITLDFPACFVSIVGRATASPELATIIMSGFDGNGYRTASGGPARAFFSQANFDPATQTWSFIHEGFGTGFIPYDQFVGETPAPLQGLDMRKLDIDEQSVGSFDSLRITRCVGLQPKCKDAVVCTSPAQQCVGNAAGSVDNGSYDATAGLPVTVTQSPPPPYALGPTPVSLTVSQGAQTATCKAQVQVGDCNAPVLTCPPATTIACTPSSVGCFDFSAKATAVDSCQTKQIATLAGCFRIGTNTVPYTATSVSGAQSTCSTALTITDDVPPVITGTGQERSVPPLLSSVDGNLHNVSLDACLVNVSDPCDGQLSLSDPVHTKITCASSDQDGCCVTMTDDVQLIDQGQAIALRAKTNPGGVTRTYTVRFAVTNKGGKTSTGACYFVVPGLPGPGGASGGGGNGAGCPSGTATGGMGGASGGGASGAGGMSGTGGAVSATGGQPGAGGATSSGGGSGATGGAAGQTGAGSGGAAGPVGGAAGAIVSPGSGGRGGTGGAGGRAMTSSGGSHGSPDAGTDGGNMPPRHAGCSAAGGAPGGEAGSRSWLMVALGTLLALRPPRRRAAPSQQQQRRDVMAAR